MLTWSVPSRDEYMTLVDTAAAASIPGYTYAADRANSILKGSDLWNGIDLLGYTASQTLYRNVNGYFYPDETPLHYAWSRTYYDIDDSRLFRLVNGQFGTNELDVIYNETLSKGFGASVRCLKDQ